MTHLNDAGPRVFISWAHRHRNWTPAQEQRWRDTVVTFANALVTSGIDTDIDLWHEHELGVDWTRWGQRQVEDSDHVVIAMNQAWAERWAGRNHPTEGVGAVGEADALHGLFARNQTVFQRRAVVVILPGADGDVPADLARLVRRRIPSLDEAGLGDLVRLMTNQPRWVRPPLGAAPRLPPHEAVPTEVPEATTTDRQQPAAGDVVQSIIAARSGNGDDVLEVPIDEAHRGSWLILRVDGNAEERHFAVKSGPRGRLQVNTTGRYRGSVLLEPGSESSLDLEVKATGPWSIELADAATSARVLDGSLDGVDDDVLRWTGRRTSLHFLGNDAERHFAVVVYMGGRRKGLINTTDSYSGRVLLPEGSALLSVRATGPWQCGVED